MHGARSPCCSTCASPGNGRRRASMARSTFRCARCRRASVSSIPTRPWSRSATTAAAASRWRCSSRKTALPKSITWWGESMPGHVPSTRLFRFTRVLVLGVACGLAAAPATAEDLLQLYREAQRNDATYGAAKHALDAGRERDNQGLALLLPTLNLSGSATRTRVEVDSRDPLILPSFTRYPESASYNLTFTQPLFRAQNWLQYQQGGHQVRQ